jgi:predicted O-linked N-acetylglucosamine transferase (SPINDLY family)
MEEVHRRRLETLELKSRETAEQHLAKCRDALCQDDRNPEAYVTLAKCYRQLGQIEEEIVLLRRAIERCESSVLLYNKYINRLEEYNRTKAAIEAAQEALRVFPDNFLFALREATILPVIYETEAQLEYYRDRYAVGLTWLSQRLRLDTPEARENALAGIGKDVFKYLSFQGRNDRSIQMVYGGIVHRIMAANFPGRVQLLAMPPIGDGGKIRIGYLSARFAHSSAMKAFGGWIREHNRNEFSVFSYHVGTHTDSVTEQVKSWSTCFRQLPANLEQMAETIRADDLHIAVFLDHGVNPISTQLAALRLAPVQCMAGDNPVTSGLPTVDYFLSGALMEPEDAQDHYSERLVRLPGVGMWFSKPVIPLAMMHKTRRDFQLREDAVVFLSGQSVHKHLPEQDEVYAQIASRIENSQFVFIVETGAECYIWKRLERSFSAASLRAADHLVMLPLQKMFDYWNLLCLSDVLLDPTGWGGAITTMESIACGLPVVTRPGPMMRGRQTYGILKQLGVTETIAGNQSEYVDIAVRLGLDRAWRDLVVRRMTQGHSRLFADTRCVAALEEFFRVTVAGLHRVGAHQSAKRGSPGRVRSDA